jgi:hypothetical protein
VQSSTDEVVFETIESLTGRNEDLSISGWEVVQVTSETKEELAPRRQINLAQFHFGIEVRRETGFYVWKLILPLTFIVFMSWAVFWIDPSVFPRLGLSATSMLTLIAYQFAISGNLPRIAYLTKADQFTVGSFALVFLSLVQGVSSSYLTRQGKVELGQKIDRFSRVAFPISFGVVFVLAFLF